MENQINIETLSMSYIAVSDKYRAHFVRNSGEEQWVTSENGIDLVEEMKKEGVSCSYDKFTRTFSF